MISYEAIATKLLSERLLLTALELHAELCEADRELPVLRDFFSNPNNFECLNMKPEPYLPMRKNFFNYLNLIYIHMNGNFYLIFLFQQDHQVKLHWTHLI